MRLDLVCRGGLGKERQLTPKPCNIAPQRHPNDAAIGTEYILSHSLGHESGAAVWWARGVDSLRFELQRGWEGFLTHQQTSEYTRLWHQLQRQTFPIDFVETGEFHAPSSSSFGLTHMFPE